MKSLRQLVRVAVAGTLFPCFVYAQPVTEPTLGTQKVLVESAASDEFEDEGARTVTAATPAGAGAMNNSTTPAAPVAVTHPAPAGATAPVIPGAATKQEIGKDSLVPPPPPVQTDSIFAENPGMTVPAEVPVAIADKPPFYSYIGGVGMGVQWVKKDRLDDAFEPEGVKISNKTMPAFSLFGYRYLTEGFRTGIRLKAMLGAVDDYSGGPRTGHFGTFSGAGFFDLMVPIQSWRVGIGGATGVGMIFAGTDPHGEIFGDASASAGGGTSDDRLPKDRIIPTSHIGPRVVLSYSWLPMLGFDLVWEYNATFQLRNAGASAKPVHSWSVTIGPVFGGQPSPAMTDLGGDEGAE